MCEYCNAPLVDGKCYNTQCGIILTYTMLLAQVVPQKDIKTVDANDDI
jgi:hypothetical protein